MGRPLNFVLLATALAAAASCTRHESPDILEPGGQTTTASVPAGEDCKPVTSIEIVHRVNGNNVTDRVLLTDDAASDASLTLRSFQVAANHYGAENIVSSHRINQIQCFPRQASSAASIIKPRDASSTSCVDWDDFQNCLQTAPSHTYDFTGTESCSATLFHDSVTVTCEDSSAIVTRNGDVVLTVNTQALRDDIASKTQALRKLVGDANVVTNIHFDIALTPEQQASIVDASAFGDIAQQIKRASDAGQSLPDVGHIIANLPNPPTNVDFYNQLTKAYNTQLDRQKMIAQIVNNGLLSPQQVNAFVQTFVGKSKLIDKLDVQHTPAALDQAKDIINDTILELATADPTSTIYEQEKSGAQSLLQAHTSNGVCDLDNVVDFVVPNLYQSLTDPDIDKQLMSADALSRINDALRKPSGRDRAHDMSGPATEMASAMQNNDMDTAWRMLDLVGGTEFFFDHTDPTGTSYDVHLTPQAQAMFNVTIEPSSVRAYQTINVFNETADFNAATGKVTFTYYATIFISGMSATNTLDIRRAQYHTEEAWGVLNFLKNAVPFLGGGILADLGIKATGIVDVITGLWSAPDAATAHLRAALSNWQQTMEMVLQEGLDIIQRWPNMTDAERQDLQARISAKVLATIPREVIEAGDLTEALHEAIRLHLDRAARGLEIIQRGHIPLSEDAAVELVKQLEPYGITDPDEAAQIADVLDDFMPCQMALTEVAGIQTPKADGDPPCDEPQVLEAFEKFKLRAKSLGFTDPQDIKDLLESGKHVGHPGMIRDDDKIFSPTEKAFAQDVLDHNGGGTIVANRADNPTRKAIDGFFREHPMQLKQDMTSPNTRNILGEVVDTQNKARQEGFRQVDVFVKGLQFTRDQVIRYARTSSLSKITMNDTIRVIDILTSEGWVHIQDGIVQ